VDRGLLAAAARDQRVQVKRGDILLVRTWAKGWGEPIDEFLGTRAFTVDACEWMLEQGVKLVGLDLPNLEGALSEQYGNMESPGHLLLLHPKREVLIVENLVNLDRIRSRRFEFYAQPLHVKGATGSPVRPVAVEEV
jgi:kynurenine formamidase